METAILVIGWLIALVATVWWFWGFVGLFKPAWMPPLSPKKRFLGFVVSWGVSLLISMAAVLFVATLNAVHTELQLQSQQPNSRQERQQRQLNGFPSKTIQQTAAEAGIRRYEAYQLITNQTAITAYCEYEVRGQRIDDQRWAMIDAGGDETSISAEADAMQSSLRLEMNERLGLIHYELATLAKAGHWRHYCRAAEMGWEVMTRDDAVNVNRGQAKRASDLMDDVLFDQIYNGTTSQYIASFGRNGFSRCKPRQHERRWYVGCQIMSDRRPSSNWILFLLGRKENTDLVLIHPVDGTAQQIWDTSFGQLVNAFPEYQRAQLADTPVSIADVRREFE